MKKIIYAFLWIMLTGNSALIAQSFTEDFNDINTLTGSGWTLKNNSQPTGSTNWFQGNPVSASGPFDAYNGAANAYIGANYNNTGGTGTISNWLLSPVRTFYNGQTIRFYTRKPSPDSYADRLEVRISTAGNSVDVGSTAASVGSFTTLALSINPNLTLGIYPTTWTQFTVTLSGLPPQGASGRFAFRYFVTSAGLSGTNSDYIGIDNVVYNASCVTSLSIAASAPTICTGGTISLSASPADSYLWSTGETTASIVASPASTTAYSVTGIVGACTAGQATTTVTVNQLPGISLSAANGALLSCANPAVTLTATATGSSAYTYTFAGSGLSAQPGSNSATVTQAGTFSVTVRSQESCISSETITVSGSNTPVGPVSINTSGAPGCGSTGVVLTASANGATSYTLLPAGTSTANGQFTLTAAGTYSIIAGNGVAGCDQSAVRTIEQGISTVAGTITASNPASEANPARLTATATGQSFVLTGPDGYVYSTVYRTPGTYTITGFGAIRPGVYTLTVSGTGGCASSTSTTTIN